MQSKLLPLVYFLARRARRGCETGKYTVLINGTAPGNIVANDAKASDFGVALHHATKCRLCGRSHLKSSQVKSADVIQFNSLGCAAQRNMLYTVGFVENDDLVRGARIPSEIDKQGNARGQW